MPGWLALLRKQDRRGVLRWGGRLSGSVPGNGAPNDSTMFRLGVARRPRPPLGAHHREAGTPPKIDSLTGSPIWAITRARLHDKLLSAARRTGK